MQILALLDDAVVVFVKKFLFRLPVAILISYSAYDATSTKSNGVKIDGSKGRFLSSFGG